MKILIFVSLSIMGCGCLMSLVVSAAEPLVTSAELSWGPVAEGFRLSLVASKTPVALNTKIDVRVSLQNDDTKPHSVVRSNPLCLYDIQVTGPDGKEVPMSEPGKEMLQVAGLGYHAIRTLEPKEESISSLDLNELFDLSSPGIYKIQISRKVRALSDNSKYVTITSNQLTIEVKAADDKNKK